MNMNIDFENILENYLNIADENQKMLAKRSKKKAGSLKARCSKNGYALDVDNKKQDDK